MGPRLPAQTLLASALLALGAAAAFVGVGFLVARPVRSGASLASVSFPVFWHSAAIVFVSQGTRTLAAYLGLDSMALVVALESLSTPFYCMSAAALLYYTLFLLTGRGSLAIPIAGYYLAMLALLRYHVALAEPTGYVVTAWQVNYVYLQPLQSASYTAALVLTVAPLLLAILAYGSLALRLPEHAMRYRVAMVFLGLALWAGFEAYSFGSGLAATSTGEVLRRATGIGGAALVAAGYLPPAFARRLWGAKPAWREARS